MMTNNLKLKDRVCDTSDLNNFVFNRERLKRFVKSQLKCANQLNGIEKELFIRKCTQIQEDLEYAPDKLFVELGKCN